MPGGLRRIAVACIAFVVAATGTEIANATAVTGRLIPLQPLIEKFVQAGPVQPPP